MGTQLIRKCDIFIDVFQKQVTEAQQRIEKLREMEQIYNAVRYGIMAYKGDQEIKVALETTSVRVDMTGTANDTLKTAQSLLDCINNEFEQMPFLQRVSKTKPSVSIGGYGVHGRISFWNKTKTASNSMNLTMSVPDEGNKDLVWHSETVHTSYPSRSLRMRDNKITWFDLPEPIKASKVFRSDLMV